VVERLAATWTFSSLTKKRSISYSRLFDLSDKLVGCNNISLLHKNVFLAFTSSTQHSSGCEFLKRIESIQSTSYYLCHVDSTRRPRTATTASSETINGCFGSVNHPLNSASCCLTRSTETHDFILDRRRKAHSYKR